MEPDEIVYTRLLSMMRVIKEKYFFKVDYGDEINMGRISETDKNTLIKLADLQVIKLLNLSRYNIRSGLISSSDDYSEEIKIEIIQPGFDDLYKELGSELKIASDPPFEKPQADGINSSKDEADTIIKTRGIKGKQRKLFRLLLSFKPVSERKISEKTETKSVKSLIFELRRKLEKTNYSIENIPPKHWEDETFYVLKFLTS